MYKDFYDAFEKVDRSYLESLCDAAYALESAGKEVDMIMRRCFAHVTRLPDGIKRNSKQSVKGSLARYLLCTFKLPKRDMTKVNSESMYLLLFMYYFIFSQYSL